MSTLFKFFFILFTAGLAVSLTGSSSHSFPPAQRINPETLELSPAQIKIFQELQIKFQKEMDQIANKMTIKRMEMRTLSRDELKGEKGDELRDQIRSLMLQAREKSLFYQQEIFDRLTPEQKEKVSSERELGFQCGPWLRGEKGFGMGMRRGPFGHHSPKESEPKP